MLIMIGGKTLPGIEKNYGKVFGRIQENKP